MALPNRQTRVTVYRSKLSTEPATGYNNVPIRKTEPGEAPRILFSDFLQNNGIQLGRDTQRNPAVDYLRFDFGDNPRDNAVSRDAFRIREFNNRTYVEVSQLCVVQEWGRAGSRRLSKDETYEIGRQNTSFRVDGNVAIYWVTIDPGLREVRYGDEEYNDEEQTDGPEMLKPGKPIYEEFEQRVSSIESYYGQFLEWPPRVNPVRDKNLVVERGGEVTKVGTTKSEIDKIKAFDAKLSYLRGYRKWEATGAPVSLIEWLTEPDNAMPFNDYWHHSRIGD
ncbi:hypothetical protein QBL07_000215 (plasmid) [Gordonia rubripertincta]|uniref:Uncharacterized protein n=1 Tax=Gordonia rubripertincta TaxID=36822 RepID=A0AAW6RC01_GORRU|nr:hypothetical protein [Gordonia rubripertincta]MCZ4537934.1 hypothetical protein [Gordonia terrae]MDG6782969.1 hypothetical protein [Gordonia rubripertincta]